MGRFGRGRLLTGEALVTGGGVAIGRLLRARRLLMRRPGTGRTCFRRVRRPGLARPAGWGALGRRRTGPLVFGGLLGAFPGLLGLFALFLLALLALLRDLGEPFLQVTEEAVELGVLPLLRLPRLLLAAAPDPRRGGEHRVAGIENGGFGRVVASSAVRQVGGGLVIGPEGVVGMRGIDAHGVGLVAHGRDLGLRGRAGEVGGGAVGVVVLGSGGGGGAVGGGGGIDPHGAGLVTDRHGTGDIGRRLLGVAEVLRAGPGAGNAAQIRRRLSAVIGGGGRAGLLPPCRVLQFAQRPDVLRPLLAVPVPEPVLFAAGVRIPAWLDPSTMADRLRGLRARDDWQSPS